jgi:DNA-binding LacI/PurR family transcriptional regulator
LWPPFSLAYYDHFPEFVERRVPVAVIDHYSTVADSVETDEEQATAVVARHLLDLGRRRIACLSSRETPSQTWAVKRRSSFEDAVRAERGAEVKSWRLNAQGTNGLEVARELLSDELRPTAVFCASDHEAQFIYQAAHELGIRIPQDLSVVGFADLDFAPNMDPPLTTMRQQPREIGRLAAELIMNRIDDAVPRADFPTTVKVAAELVTRESTARCRAD